MYAVIETGGKQVRVREGEELQVEKLEGDPGSQVTFEKVLLISWGATETGRSPLVGKPYVKEARVIGKIVEQDRGPKIRVFKYKPKKRVRKTQGHAQHLTRVKIEKIAVG